MFLPDLKHVMYMLKKLNKKIHLDYSLLFHLAACGFFGLLLQQLFFPLRTRLWFHPPLQGSLERQTQGKLKQSHTKSEIN